MLRENVETYAKVFAEKLAKYASQRPGETQFANYFEQCLKEFKASAGIPESNPQARTTGGGCGAALQACATGCYGRGGSEQQQRSCLAGCIDAFCNCMHL